MSAISALIRPDRYPLSSRYDPRWVIALEMGPHPLWQLEDILPALALEPGSRFSISAAAAAQPPSSSPVSVG